jgi:hypothetical protein
MRSLDTGGDHLSHHVAHWDSSCTVTDLEQSRLHSTKLGAVVARKRAYLGFLEAAAVSKSSSRLGTGLARSHSNEYDPTAFEGLPV